MTFVFFLYLSWLLVINAIQENVSHLSILSLYLTQEDEHSEREHRYSCNIIVVVFTFFTFLFIM